MITRADFYSALFVIIAVLILIKMEEHDLDASTFIQGSILAAVITGVAFGIAVGLHQFGI